MITPVIRNYPVLLLRSTLARMKFSLRYFALLVVMASLQSASASSVLQAGEDWLKWNEQSRVNYVSAYLWGHARGFRDGCQTGQQIYSVSESKGLPGEKCIGKQPQYSKKLEDYAAAITKFYNSYPQDKRVPVVKLLDGMSDRRNLSFQQMHDYYGTAKGR